MQKLLRGATRNNESASKISFERLQIKMPLTSQQAVQDEISYLFQVRPNNWPSGYIPINGGAEELEWILDVAKKCLPSDTIFRCMLASISPDKYKVAQSAITILQSKSGPIIGTGGSQFPYEALAKVLADPTMVGLEKPDDLRALFNIVATQQPFQTPSVLSVLGKCLAKPSNFACVPELFATTLKIPTANRTPALTAAIEATVLAQAR